MLHKNVPSKAKKKKTYPILGMYSDLKFKEGKELEKEDGHGR